MSTNENAMRRADEIRARRLQRREGRPTIGRAKASQAPSIPNMVARNPQIERRLQTASRNEGRRRNYLKLGDRGAELRLPALPSVRIGWRVFSGLTVAICLFALYSMFMSARFIVNRVELSGAERLDGNAVNSALQVSGAWIFDVQPERMLGILEAQFPELETVSISVGFPARVIVKVVERLPVVSWEQAGLQVWIDAAGIAFLPQESGAGLISVSAIEPPPALAADAAARHQLITPQMVAAIQALSQFAPQGVTLLYDPKMGFGWNDPSGWLAFFGQDGVDIDQRLAIYQTIVAELAARRLSPTLVSVAQLHAPYYRMDY
jgi:cell division septal protein FtsQ